MVNGNLSNGFSPIPHGGILSIGFFNLGIGFANDTTGMRRLQRLLHKGLSPTKQHLVSK